MVAPFTGAWIEIALQFLPAGPWMSLPSRERGLKLAGVDDLAVHAGRSLHGSVD